MKEKWEAQPPKEKVWWIRSATAVLASVVSTIIRPVLNSFVFDLIWPSPASTIAALFGLTLILILPFLLSRIILKITPQQLGGWSPFFTSGIITALFLWITLWTVAYNVLATW
ncbi:MAG: hypothetical protein QXK94_01070 [Candidatus Jordarchaeales archaeon]